MNQKHFVQLLLGSKTFKDQVSTEGCQNVADFREEIKKKFSPDLDSYPTHRLTLYEADGTTVIDPETDIEDLFVTKGKPLIVKVEENPIQKPTISSSRHYKQAKAVRSSRSYLTSIAVELDQIYPITAQKFKGKRRITFGDIVNEAYEVNPEPKPELRNRYTKKLNDFYTETEWNILEELNDNVNPKLHEALTYGLDGKTKEVILPIEVSHFGQDFKRIAKKTNIVSEANDLIVKNEGSVSGGSPETDKKV